MPSGVIRLRMSKRNHSTGRQANVQTDTSGLRGLKYKEVKAPLTQYGEQFPPTRPFKSTHGTFAPATIPTPAAKAMEDIDAGTEGPKRHGMGKSEKNKV